MKPFVLGIGGGTGSGKTTIANTVHDHFPHTSITIAHDRYYKSQQDKTMQQRKKTNYDHPNALETDLFIKHLKQIVKGKTVEVPKYDFTKHTRIIGKTTTISPHPLIIVEGILIFANATLRELFDLKVYVDVPADIRILRRTKRDIQDRGRTLDFCIEQYTTLTRPMHEQFVEPTKEYADIIITQGGNNKKAIHTLTDAIEKKLQLPYHI